MFESNEKEKHTFKESAPQLPPMDCEHCVYYVYDEEADEDFCDLSLDEDEEITYSIVGSNQADPLDQKISDQSPIGRALMGKRAGDNVEVQAPNGTLHFKVLHVERTK